MIKNITVIDVIEEQDPIHYVWDQETMDENYHMLVIENITHCDMKMVVEICLFDNYNYME